MFKKPLIFLPALLLTFLVSGSSAFAQLQGVEITSVFTVADKKAADGDILIMSDKGLVRADVEFDSHLFGVLQKQPVMSYRRIDNAGQPVARTGIAEVNVTTLAGPIASGDYITSSPVAGKGQKAARNGYVIGRALSALKDGQGQQMDYAGKKITSGKVTVALKAEYADELGGVRSASRVADMLGSTLFTSLQSPDKFGMIIRYIAAGLVSLAALLIGFFTFSRSLAKSVEAIGRNPLAKTSIYLSLGINIFFTIIITALGIAAAIVLIKI